MAILKQITFFCLWLITISAFSQDKSILDDMSSYSIQFLGDDGHIEGTGFYYCDSSDLFFVTARHNIFEIIGTDTLKKKYAFSYKPFIKKAKLISYSDQFNKNDNHNLEINVEKLYNDNYLFYYKDYDIVIIQVGSDAKLENNAIMTDENYVTKSDITFPIITFTNYHVCKYKDLNYGDDVALIGYPNSIGLKNLMQYDNKKPLFKKGYIAGKYPEINTFIIDCEAYHGNSGGPVYKINHLFSENNSTKILPRFEIVGVVTQFIPISKDTFVNTTYSVAVSFDIVLEMIEQYKGLKRGLKKIKNNNSKKAH